MPIEPDDDELLPVGSKKKGGLPKLPPGKAKKPVPGAAVPIWQKIAAAMLNK